LSRYSPAPQLNSAVNSKIRSIEELSRLNDDINRSVKSLRNVLDVRPRS
jgi:hypothetical protein